MNDTNFLNTLGASLNQHASVDTAFGEPVRAGEKVVITVARLMLGMGGGYGHGPHQTKKILLAKSTQTGLSDEPANQGGGAGGGGGMRVIPLGVYEITPTRTRFIPVYDTKVILISLIVTTGFLLGRLAVSKLGRKRR